MISSKVRFYFHCSVAKFTPNMVEISHSLCVLFPFGEGNARRERSFGRLLFLQSSLIFQINVTQDFWSKCRQYYSTLAMKYLVVEWQTGSNNEMVILSLRLGRCEFQFHDNVQNSLQFNHILNKSKRYNSVQILFP